jgi:hypothetical protein
MGEHDKQNFSVYNIVQPGQGPPLRTYRSVPIPVESKYPLPSDLMGTRNGGYRR